MNRNRLGIALLLAVLLGMLVIGGRLPAETGRSCGAADDHPPVLGRG